MTEERTIGHCPKCFKKQREMILKSFMAVYKNRKLIQPPHYQLICPDCGVVLDEEELSVLFDKEFEAHALHLGKLKELEEYRQGKYRLHWRDGRVD